MVRRRLTNINKTLVFPRQYSTPVFVSPRVIVTKLPGRISAEILLPTSTFMSGLPPRPTFPPPADRDRDRDRRPPPRAFSPRRRDERDMRDMRDMRGGYQARDPRDGYYDGGRRGYSRERGFDREREFERDRGRRGNLREIEEEEVASWLQKSQQRPKISSERSWTSFQSLSRSGSSSSQKFTAAIQRQNSKSSTTLLSLSSPTITLSPSFSSSS
ncbi:hypothetical protein BDP27DRAFT_999921 [Rhodocollybia butyracea]|uniref:Uncharacterized protein n=1 Tax=Rhodocollybia butyracea TaxID=206335 RepID=A0A9P5U6B3_9AGAR|nr:hypothetical protein BDP27DRAFT_999921 [Rhodocollybia butyracea]